MTSIGNAAMGILSQAWQVLLISSPYVVFGFTIAALIKALMPDEFISRHLGRDGALAVFKATLFGIPLPLCSCGVIPAAISLRKQGASRGATSAFLVATPETGVDSISITYALLDPVMTVFRPLAAFATAMAAGLAENWFQRRLPEPPAPPPASCCDGKTAPAASSCCGEKIAATADPIGASLWRRLRESVRYTFVNLLVEVGPWLLLGVLLAGAITYLLPDNLIEAYIGRGLLSMLVMLVVGMPLYVCATASTPVAAALVMKGLSPGAALVFLLAGPATNAATITVIGRFLGPRSLAIYLTSLAVCSVALGLLLDALYAGWGWSLEPKLAHAAHEHAGVWELGATALLLALIAHALWRKYRFATKPQAADAADLRRAD